MRTGARFGTFRQLFLACALMAGTGVLRHPVQAVSEHPNSGTGRVVPVAGRARARRMPPAPARPPATPLKRMAGTYAGSVVTVDAYKEGDAVPVHRRGTGVLATQSGYVFAPLFVVNGAEVVIVNFGPETRSPARVLARDPRSQLAILKTTFTPDNRVCPNLCGADAERENTPVAMVGLRAGEPRVLLGSIQGLRDQVGPLSDVLEIAVQGDPGEVGGILLDESGSLVGLALAVGPPEEGSRGSRVYALPASRIRQAIDRILSEGPSDRDREGILTIA